MKGSRKFTTNLSKLGPLLWTEDSSRCLSLSTFLATHAWPLNLPKFWSRDLQKRRTIKDWEIEQTNVLHEGERCYVLSKNHFTEVVLRLERDILEICVNCGRKRLSSWCLTTPQYKPIRQHNLHWFYPSVLIDITTTHLDIRRTVSLTRKARNRLGNASWIFQLVDDRSQATFISWGGRRGRRRGWRRIRWIARYGADNDSERNGYDGCYKDNEALFHHCSFFFFLLSAFFSQISSDQERFLIIRWSGFRNDDDYESSECNVTLTWSSFSGKDGRDNERPVLSSHFWYTDDNKFWLLWSLESLTMEGQETLLKWILPRFLPVGVKCWKKDQDQWTYFTVGSNSCVLPIHDCDHSHSRVSYIRHYETWEGLAEILFHLTRKNLVVFREKAILFSS